MARIKIKEVNRMNEVVLENKYEQVVLFLKQVKKIGLESINAKIMGAEISAVFVNNKQVKKEEKKIEEEEEKEDIIEEIEKKLSLLPEEQKQDILKKREELQMCESILLDPLKFINHIKEGNIDAATTGTNE